MLDEYYGAQGCVGAAWTRARGSPPPGPRYLASGDSQSELTLLLTSDNMKVHARASFQTLFAAIGCIL